MTMNRTPKPLAASSTTNTWLIPPRALRSVPALKKVAALK